jgi:hypothetical protein
MSEPEQEPPTYETLCALLGEKDVQIYLRNVVIAELQQRVADLDTKVAVLEKYIERRDVSDLIADAQNMCP